MKSLTIFLFVILLTSAARAQLVPLIEVKTGGLLGGVENGKYFDAKTTFARLRGEGRYSLYGIRGRTGELTATVEPPDEPCEDFYFAKSRLEGQKGIALGSARKWNPAPRTAKTVNPNNKTYLDVVSGILRAKGLPNARAKIEQAVKVDLDGDGREEVVLTASSYGGKIAPSAKTGDYSFLLVRKIVGGKVKNIMVAEEYVKKNVEFGAPSRFELSAIADLDGDGAMEIVAYSEYYEGSSAGVYQITDRAVAVKELQAGCGV
ncbi:MAG TPA: VCBS repeat-containing protein [Pyrinomonadaceae bacterium]|jgi:hypothetical protein